MSGLMLSKMIGQLLLPPADLILVGLIGILMWRHRWGKPLVILSFLLLWLFSIAPVRDGLLNPLQNRYLPLAQNAKLGSPKDTAIVVLGGSMYPRAPEYDGEDALKGDSLSRTVYASALAHRSGLPVYTSGGPPLRGKAEPEGSVMRRWLIRFGVPKNRVTAETLSETTWQNARNLRSLLEKRGIRRIVLVTSAWHMPRAVWCMKAQGFNVIPAPCDYLGTRQPYDLLNYLPNWDVLAGTGDALHEYLGLLWYRIWFGFLAI